MTAAASLTIIPVPAFEGADVVTLSWQGAPAWTAAQVSDLLGYSDCLSIAQAVRVRWADEFVEGEDFVVVSGDDLRLFKAGGAVAKNAPSVMLLTESGFNLAIIKSRQPVSVALRRWLAREVLPALRRTGGYVRATKAADPVRVARELRLSGDCLGGVNHLRAHVGLPLLAELPGARASRPRPSTARVDPAHDQIAEYLAARDEVVIRDVVAALDLRAPRDDRRVGRVLRQLGWTEHRHRHPSGLRRIWRAPLETP